MKNKLKSIKVKVFYDKNVRRVTKKDSEEVMISEGLDFPNFLNSIFSSYPDLQKRFPPGTLGFLLNGKAPKEYDILKYDDKMEFVYVNPEHTREKIESQLTDIIRYYQIDITLEEIKEMIFNEDGQEDFNKLIDIFTGKIGGDVNEINAVLQIVNAAWNYFPHKALKGLSPIEKIELTKIKT